MKASCELNIDRNWRPVDYFGIRQTTKRQKNIKTRLTRGGWGGGKLKK